MTDHSMPEQVDPEAVAKLPRHHVFTTLRVEVLLSLGLLASTAVLLTVATYVLFDRWITHPYGEVMMVALLVADLALFVMIGDHKFRELVLYPLEAVVQTTEAVANGDLARRAPPGTSTEFARLASSINRMTSTLLEDQALRARFEKVASVGRLADGVAQEIGLPLESIASHTGTIRRQAHSAELLEAVSGIERERDRIDRIVRGMLDFARPRQSVHEAIDVNGSIYEALELLRDQGALQEVDIDLQLGAQLPPLEGDSLEMRQVVVNLLLNAVDAMNGEGDITVFTSVVPFASLTGDAARRQGDPHSLTNTREPSARVKAWLSTVGDPERVLKLIVADSGPGVPWTHVERIFDPFFTTKPSGKGTGLGLAIVSRVVEGMGGTIWVRPSREEGAAFVLLFPVPVIRPVTVESLRTATAALSA
ncbi:MAG TPA: ATP-binding protein [Gemmatimonadaceae bacterium]|nr:ATP-binding protein [Gemmatimonadaceae bacterium]